MKKHGKPLHHHLWDYFFPHPRNNHHPHLFGYTSLIAIATLIAVAEIGYVTQTKYVFLNTEFLASVLPSVLTDLTNTDRTDNGLAPLVRSARLDAAAQAAAEDMASKGYFAHIAPDGTTPWYWLDEAGYEYRYAGQNLAVNFTDSKNVQDAWLASPTHRENIMKPEYTQIGFGTATGTYQGQQTTFVVQFFATPPAVVATKLVMLGKSATVGTEPPQLVATTSVLGTEVEQAVPAALASFEEAMPVAEKKFVSLLASPFSTLETLLTILLGIVVSAFGFTMFMRGKLQHPKVVYAGSFLMLLISVTFLASVMLSSPVILSNDPQLASVEAAL